MEAFLEFWKQPQNPTTWMKNSCVWYSQVLTKKLGMHKFDDYVKKFEYGNQDITGDKGQNNGLTNSWLSSSLEISPQEQIGFLEKLLARSLPVSQQAQKTTQDILYVQDLGGWKLYGKTGSGYLYKDGKKSAIKHGWFIGWIEKDNRQVVFAHHLIDLQENDSHAGPRARDQAKIKLLEQILTLE